jgi:hypothetical protein
MPPIYGSIGRCILHCDRQDTGRPPPGRDSAMDRCPDRTPTQRGTKPRGKCAGPGCRRYFGGSWTESSILASPRFSSKSPIFLLVPVRLVPSVSEFAPALEPARCTEVLARPLLLLAAGSCSTLRRCVCRPPWPELAFASAFVADFAPFLDPELLPSSSFELVLVEALLGLPSSSFELVLVEALLDLLSSSLDLVPVEAMPGLTE